MTTLSFGDWIRRRRAVLDLTQAELAVRVACAVITIRKIENDERRPSAQMANSLATALEVPADERDRFVATARAISSPARLKEPALATGRASVPTPVTPLIGRDAELAEMLPLLADDSGVRLLTLTGPPGVGKTRLAYALARRAEGEYDRPVVIVELATADDVASVQSRIGAAVSVAAAGSDLFEAAKEVLGRGQTLLVLDNFEQALSARKEISDLLSRIPGLTCLVTSRIRLDVYGEHEVVIAPLALDDAVALFKERATAANRTVRLSEEETAVSQICETLDCLPLAIELAARRARDLDIRHIAGGLETGLGVLGTGPADQSERQRTITAAVEWSYSLLSAPAQRALRAASVMAGSFTADDLAAVAGLDHAQAEAAATELADHALVSRVAGAFNTFEIVRAVAAQRLADHGEEPATRLRHAQACAAFVEVAPPLLTPDRIDERYADIRAALEWSLASRNIDLAARMVRWLGSYWMARGLFAEGIAFTEQTRELAFTPGERAAALLSLGVLQWVQRLPEGPAIMRDALAAARETGDPFLLADILGFVALGGMFTGDPEAADQLAESRRLYEEVGYPVGVALSEMRAARLSLITGDPEGFELKARKAADMFRAEDAPWGTAGALHDVAEAQIMRGEPAAGIQTCLEAMAEAQKVGAEWYSAAAAVIMVSALRAQQRTQDAARLCGIVEEWHDQMGAPIFPIVAANYAKDRERLSATERDFEALTEEGRYLPHTIEYLSDFAGRDDGPRN